MSRDTTPQSPPSIDGTPRLLGCLAGRGWTTKLYAPESVAAGLRPEECVAVERAFRAVIAAPGPAVAGFSLLRRPPGAGGLILVVHWWEDAVLRRAALLLPGEGDPPRRAPEEAMGRVGSVEELVLMAREATVWRRCVLDATMPSAEAYLAGGGA
jgi:hypothetical protein